MEKVKTTDGEEVRCGEAHMEAEEYGQRMGNDTGFQGVEGGRTMEADFGGLTASDVTSAQMENVSEVGRLLSDPNIIPVPPISDSQQCRSEQIVLESTTPFKEENGLKVSYDIHTPPNTTIDDQLVADDNGGAKTLSEHQCLPVLDVRCPVTELTADLTCQQGAGESTPFPSGSSDDHPAKEERTIPVSPPLSRTGLLWEDIESEASFPHTTKIKETMTDGEEMGCDEAHMEAEDDGQRIGNETGLQVVEGGRTKKAYFGGLTASDVSSAQIENASEVGRLLSDPKTIPVPSFLDSQLYGLESEHIVLDNMTPFKEMGLNSSYVTQNPPHPIVHDQLVADGNGQAMTLSENQCLPVLDVRCPVTELTADLTCQQGARESTPLPSGSSNDHPERRSTILVSPPLSRTGLLGEEIKSEASFPHTTKIKEKMTDGEKEECGAAHMEALVYGQRMGHETRLQNEDEGRTKEPDSGGLTTSDETSTLTEKVSEVGRLPSDPEIVSVPSISDSQQCGSELEQMKWSCALQSKEENGLKVSYDMHTPPDTTVDNQLEADGNGGAKTLSEHQCLPVLDVRCPVTELTADMSYQKRAGERIPFSSGRSDDHLAKEESTITLSPPFCRTGLSSEDMESEVDCPDGEEVGYGEARMEAEEYGQRMGNETGFQEVEGDRTKEADVGSLTPSDVASAQTENVSEVGKQFSDPNIIPVPPISNSQGCGSESEQIALDTTIPFKEENGLKLSSHMHTPPNTTVDDHLDADGNRGAMALSENQCLPVLDVRCPVTELTADLTCQQGAGESTPFLSGSSNDHPAKEESTITVSSLLCRTGLSSEDMESEADCPHTTKIKENMTDGEEEECSVAPMEALVYGQRKGNETRLQNEEGGRTTEADVGGLTASDITSAQTKNVSEVGRLFSDPNIIPVLPISNSQGCGSESGQIALETTVPFKEENGLKVSYACMHTPPDTVVHTLVAGGNGGAMASNENQCLPVLDLRCPVTELTADLTCQKGARERTYFPSVSSDDHLAKEESTITVLPPLCRTGLMLEDSKTEADLPHRIPLPGKYVVDMGMEDKAEMSVALRQTKTHVSTLMHTSIGLVDAENKIEVVPHVNFQTSELKCLESMVSSLSQSKLDESLRNCHDFARIPPKRKHRKTDVSPLTVMKGQLSLEPEIKRHPKKGRKMSAMPAVTASSPQKWDAGTSSNCELNNPYSLNGATEQLHMGIYKQSKNKRKNLKMNQEMRTKSIDMDKVDATTNPEQCKTVLDSNAPQSQPSKKCQKKNKKGISSLLKTEVSGGGGQAGDSIDIKPEDKSGQLDNSLKNLMEGRAVAGVPDSCTGRQTAEISYQALTDSVFLETAIPSVVKPVGNVTETTVKHAVMIEGVEDEKKLIDSLPNNSNLAESFEVLNNSTGIDQKVKRKSKKKREAVRKKRAWTAQTKLEVHESIELGEIPISGIGDKLDIHGQCKNETEMRIAQQVSIARDKEEDGKNTSPVCLRENENILSPENIYDHNSQIPKTMKGSKTKRLTLLPPETHLRSHSSTCSDISLDIPPVSETPLHQSPTVLTVYNEFEASHFIKQKPCRKRRAQKSKRKSQVVGSQETCIIIHEENGGAKGSSTAVTSDASPQNDTVFHNKKKRGNPRKKVINEETNDMQQDQQTVSQVISNSFEQQSQNVSRMVLVLPPEVKNESEGEFPTSTTKKNVRKPKKQKLISRVSPLELVESKEHCADVKIPEPTSSLLTPGPGGGKTNGTFTQVDKEAQGNVKKDMKEQKEEMIAVTSVKEEHVGAEERLDVLDVPVRKLKKKLGRPYKKKRLVKMAKPLKFAEEQRSDERDTSALTELRNDCLPQEVIHHIPQRCKVRKISKKVKQALNPPVTNMKRYSRACKLTMVEKTEEYFAHEHDQLTLLVGSTDPLHVQRGRISSSAAGLSVPEASNKIDAFKYLDQKPRRQRKRPKNRMESQAKDGGQEALLAFHEAGVEAKSAMPDNLVFIKEKRGYPRKKVLKEGITCIQNNAQTIPKVPGNPEQQSDNVSQFPNVSSSEIKTDLEGPSILSLKKKLKKPKKQKCTSINFPKELIASTENKMDMMILDTTNSLIIPQKADCKMMSSLPQVNKSEHWNHENMKVVKDDIETSGTIMKSKRKNSRLCKKKAQNIEIAKKLAMEQSSNSVDLTAENQLEKSFPLDISSQQVKKGKMKKESKKVKLGSFTPVTQLRKNTQACKINSIDEKEDHCAQNPERILIATSGSTSPLNFLNGEISPSPAVSVVSSKACDFHEPKPLRRERAPKKERTPPKRKAKGPVGNKQILSVHEHEVGASPVSGTTGTSELVPNSFLTHNSPKCHHPLKKVLKEETAIQENMPKSVSGNLFEQQTCNGLAQGLVPPSEIKNDSPETFETSVLSMKKKIKKHRIQKPNCKISPEVMFDNTEHSAEMCQGVANDILIPQQSGCEAFGTVKRVVKGIHRNIKKRKAARKKIIKPPSTLKEPKTTGDVFAIHGGAVTKVKRSRPPTPIAQLRRYSRACKVTTDYTFDKIKDRLEYNLKLSSSTYVKQEILGSLEPKITSETIVQFASANASDVQSLSQEHTNIKTLESNTVLNSIEHAKVHEDTTTFDTLLSLDTGTTPLFQEIVELNSRDLITKKPRKKIGLKKGRKRRKTWWDDRGKAKRLLGATLGTALETKKLRDLEVGKEKDIAHVCSQIDDVLPNSCSSVGTGTDTGTIDELLPQKPEKETEKETTMLLSQVKSAVLPREQQSITGDHIKQGKLVEIKPIQGLEADPQPTVGLLGHMQGTCKKSKLQSVITEPRVLRDRTPGRIKQGAYRAKVRPVEISQSDCGVSHTTLESKMEGAPKLEVISTESESSAWRKEPKEVLTTKNDSSNTLVNHSDKAGSQVFAKMEEQSILIKDLQRDKLHIEMKDTLLPEACSSKSSSVVSQDILIPQQSGCETFGMVTRVIKGAQRNMKKRKTVKAAMIKPTSNLGEPRKEKDILAILQTNGAITKVKRKRGRPYKKITLKKMAKQLAFIEEQRLKGSKEVAAVNQINNHSTPQEISGKKDKLASPPTPVVHARRSSRTCNVTTDNSFNKIKDHSENNQNFTSSKYVSDTLLYFPGKGVKQEIIQSVETEKTLETVIQFASVDTVPSEVQNHSHEHSNIKAPESSTLLNYEEDSKLREDTTAFTTSISLGTGMTQSFQEIDELNSIELVTKKPRKTVGSKKKGKKRRRTWWDDRGKAKGLQNATTGTVLKTYQDEGRLQPALGEKMPDEENYNSDTKLLIHGQRIHEKYSNSDITEAQLCDFHSEKADGEIAMGQSPLANGENDVQHAPEDLEATINVNCKSQETNDLEEGKEQDIACVYSQHSDVLPNSCSSVGDTGTINAILPEKSEKEAKEEITILLSQDESAVLSRKQQNTTEYNLNLTSSKYVSDILPSFPGMEDKQEIIGSVGTETENISETIINFASVNTAPSEVQSLSKEHSNIKNPESSTVLNLLEDAKVHEHTTSFNTSFSLDTGKAMSLLEIVELNSIKLVTKKPRKTIGSRKRGKKRKRTWWDERGKANKLLKATRGTVLKTSQDERRLQPALEGKIPEEQNYNSCTKLLICGQRIHEQYSDSDISEAQLDDFHSEKTEWKISVGQGPLADGENDVQHTHEDLEATTKMNCNNQESMDLEIGKEQDSQHSEVLPNSCSSVGDTGTINAILPEKSEKEAKEETITLLSQVESAVLSREQVNTTEYNLNLTSPTYVSDILLSFPQMEDKQEIIGSAETEKTSETFVHFDSANMPPSEVQSLSQEHSNIKTTSLQEIVELNSIKLVTKKPRKTIGSRKRGKKRKRTWWDERGKANKLLKATLGSVLKKSQNADGLTNSYSTVEDTGTNEVLSQKPEKETKEEPTTLLSQVESAVHSREQQNSTEDEVQGAKLEKIKPTEGLEAEPQPNIGPLGHMQGTCKKTKRQKKSYIREPRVLRDRTRDRTKQDAYGTNLTLVEMSQSNCEVPHTSLESIKDGVAGKLEIEVISTQSKSSAQGKAPEQKLSTKKYSSEALNHSHMEDLQVFGKVEEQSTLIKDGQRSKLGTANSENDLQCASEDLEATTMMSCKSHGSKDVEVGKEQDIAHVYSHNVEVLPNSRSTVEDTGTNEVLSQKPEKETKEEPTTLLSQVESAVHSREQQNTTEDQVQMAKLDPQTTLGPLGHMQGTCKTTERQKKSDIREPRVLRDRTRDRIKQDACGTNMTLVEMSRSSCEVPHTSLESIKDGAAGKLEIAVISTQSKSSAQGKAPEQKLSAKTYSSEALLNHSHMEDLQVFGKVEEQSTLIKDGQRSELGIANSENDLQHASEEDLEVTTKMSCKSHGSKDVEVGKEQDIAHVYSHNAEVLPNSRSTVEDTGTNEVLSQKPEKETKDEPTTLLSQLESAVHSREQQNTTEDQVKEGKLEKVKPIEDLEADPQPNKRRKLSVTTEPRVLRDRTRGRIKEDAHGANLTLVEISQSNCEVSHTSLESTEEEAGKLKIVISKDSEDYSSEALLNHSDMEDSWFFAEVEEQSVLIKHVQRVKSKMEMEVTPLSEACSSQSSFSKLVVSEDQQIGDEEQLEDADNGNRHNQDNQERDTVEKVTDDSNLIANPSEILVSACLPKKDKCPAKCHFCGRSFRHITAYIIHRRIHTGEKPYSCQECGKTFAQRSHLNVHKKVHKLPGQFQCPLCTSRFSLRDKLLSHFLTHTNYLNRNTLVGESTNDSAQIKAKINARISSSSFSLQDGKPFKCINCEKQFRYSVTLKRHTCVQKGDKHFSCKVCDKAFNKVYKLSDHEKIHWPVKPFACSVCGKAFSQLGALKTHSRTHTGEKPFTCPHCGDAFLQLKSLRTHQASKLCLSKGMGEDGNNGCMEDFVECLEGQETPTEFQCQVCSKSYDIQSDYNRHLLTHTDVQTSVCDACGKQLNNSSDHNAHLQICCRFNGTESQNTFLSDVYDTSQLQHNQPAQSPDHLQTLPLNNQQSKCTGPSVNTMHGSVTQPEYSSTVADQLKICESSSTDSRLVSTSTNGSIGSCCELFKSPKRIQAHLLSSTSHYSYTCGRCGKALANWNKYWLHQRVHCQKPGGFCCPQCSQHFRFHGLYKEHMLEHAKQNPYACPVCPIAFADKESLMDHQGKEHKVCDTHKCRTCGRGFIHLRNLERHSLRHRGAHPRRHSLGNRSGVLQCPLTTDSHCHPLPDVPAEAVSLNRCGECDANFTTLDMLAIHRLCHSTGDRNPQDGEIVAGSLAPEHQLQARSTPSPTPVLSSSPLVSPVEHESLYAYQHPEDLYVYRTPSTSFPPPVLPYITNVFCYRGPSKMNTSNTKPPALLNTFDSNRLPVIKKHVLSDHLYAAPPRACLAPSSSDSPSASLSAPGGKHPPPPRISKPLQLSSSSLSLQSSWAQASPNAQINTIQFRSNGDSWVDFSSLPLSYVKLKNKEETQDSLECAECETQFGAVSELYEHYIQHARGEV